MMLVVCSITSGIDFEMVRNFSPFFFFLENFCRIFYIIIASDKDKHFQTEDMKMEKFSTFNTDKKYTEVIAQLDCCETCESATFSENKKTKQQQPTTAVIRV